jgi:hypothetical protein
VIPPALLFFAQNFVGYLGSFMLLENFKIDFSFPVEKKLHFYEDCIGYVDH